MQKHIVLVIEGSGAKMPMQVAEIEYIETKLNKLMTEIFDLTVTTSAGAVETSILNTAKMRCVMLKDILMGKRTDTNKNTTAFIKKIFTPKGLFSIPRYDQQQYVRQYNQLIGDVPMSASIIQCLMTSVNECDGLTHFFKSWEDKDGKLKMTDATCKSFAAPYFFGEIIDDASKAIWGDGGIGVCNLPLVEAYTQARLNGWLEPGHQTHILALCAGFAKYTVDFNKYKKYNWLSKLISGLKYFTNLKNGGCARASATVQQIRWLQANTKTYDNLTFQFVNWENMPKDLDAMDNWKARWTYYDKGVELAKTIDLDKLQK
jgi:hypothetical protein